MAHNYFHWSLEQLYLMFCWPSEFRNKVEGIIHAGQPRFSYHQRFTYLIKLSPWFIGFSILCNLILGMLCEAFGVLYLWGPSWVGLVLGLACGMVFGVVVGVATGFSSSISASGVLAVSAGVIVGGSLRNWVTFVLGVFAGLFVIIAVGLAIRHKRFIRDRESVYPVVLLALVIAALSGTGLAIAIFTPTFRSPVSVDIAKGMAVSVGVAVSSASMTGLGLGAILGLTRGRLLGFIFGVSMSTAGALAFAIPAGAFYGSELGTTVGLGFLFTFSIAFWATYFRIVSYPIDLAFAVFAYLRAQNPNGAISAWRWCPVAWNEVSWLPLPLVSRVLVLCIKEDERRGFDILTFIAAERALQARVARAALVEVAVNSLVIEDLTEIALVANRMSWISAARLDLPSILIASMPRFERVSRQTAQYLTNPSTYQRRMALGQAIDELESLQLSLVASKWATSPRLLQLANKWHQILQDEREVVLQQIQISEEIPNPFWFGIPIDQARHNVFMGRLDIMRDIESSILRASQTPTLLLQGARRMGKTSILKQLPRLLGPDLAPAFLDCTDTATRETASSFLYHLSLAILEGLHERNVLIDELHRSEMDGSEPFARFDEWLRKVERKLPKGMRILLCIDEYEHLQPQVQNGWLLDVLNTFRHWIQHRPQLLLMFCGAHTFAEMGPLWTSRFINARRIRVSFLKREDVITLLTEPTPDFNMQYAPGALDALVNTTNCQPFLTQAVAFELVQLLNEENRTLACMSDIENSITQAFDSGSSYFHNVWTDAKEQGQTVLRAIAHGDPAPQLPEALTWLREHDVLTHTNSFAVPMMERWVRNHRKTELRTP
jgi:hypothetical protein